MTSSALKQAVYFAGVRPTGSPDGTIARTIREYIKQGMWLSIDVAFT